MVVRLSCFAMRPLRRARFCWRDAINRRGVKCAVPLNRLQRILATCYCTDERGADQAYGVVEFWMAGVSQSGLRGEELHDRIEERRPSGWFTDDRRLRPSRRRSGA